LIQNGSSSVDICARDRSVKIYKQLRQDGSKVPIFVRTILRRRLHKLMVPVESGDVDGLDG
jgi:hypothetical protein